MKTFKVTIFAPVFAIVEIEAESMSEAISKAGKKEFNRSELELLDDPIRVDQVLEDLTEEKEGA